MTPQEFLSRSQRQVEAMQRAKSASVKVGLPAGESATSKAYKSDGQKSAPTVLEVGIWHEYGTQHIPMRSFLRGPFAEKKADLDRIIAAQLKMVLENDLNVEVALGRVGLAAVNISRRAFTTRGYGVWADISQATKDAKGSSQVLIDTGILRNAITWVVE